MVNSVKQKQEVKKRNREQNPLPFLPRDQLSQYTSVCLSSGSLVVDNLQLTVSKTVRERASERERERERVRVSSAQPGGGDPLGLSVQLVDESQQLLEGLVLVCVHDGRIEQVAEVLLHLSGLLDDVTQLLRLGGEREEQSGVDGG